MNKLKIVSITGQSVGEFTLPTTFKVLDKLHNQALFDSVLSEQAAMRQGTHSTKTKAEVSGTGKKPYAQKKTGNARQGSKRNPHYVGGGIAFGPKPNRNYKKDLNRKAHKLAHLSALTYLLKKQQITVLANDAMVNDVPSAKLIYDLLVALELIDRKVLLVVNESNANLLLSARNLKKVIVKPVSCVSVRDLLNNKHVLIQQDGLNRILGEHK